MPYFKELTCKTFLQSLKIQTPVAGYENFYIMADSDILCQECAKEDRNSIVYSIAHDLNDTDMAKHMDTTMNYDPGTIWCNRCNRTL